MAIIAQHNKMIESSISYTKLRVSNIDPIERKMQIKLHTVLMNISIE